MKTSFLILTSLFFLSCQQEKEGNISSASIDKNWSQQNWPSARGGASLSGRVHDAVIDSPKILWTHKSEGPISGEAIMIEESVVFGNHLGHLTSLNFRTGKVQWMIELPDSIEAAPAAAEGLLFVGCDDYVLYALNLENGKERWRYETDDKITAGVNLTKSPDGREIWVLLNGYDGVARALRAASGEVVWEYETESPINGTPAIVAGKWVVFGGCDAHLYCLDLATGKPVKTVETEAEIVSTVATSGPFVAWGNHGNEVLTADTEKGELSWIYRDRKFPFMSAPAIDAERVVIGGRDKKIHAIKRENGMPMWKYQTRGRVDSSPLIFNDAVVCGSSDGRLYALTLEKGEEKWFLDLGEALVAAPSFARGMIVIGGEDGTLFAID